MLACISDTNLCELSPGALVTSGNSAPRCDATTDPNDYEGGCAPAAATPPTSVEVRACSDFSVNPPSSKAQAKAACEAARVLPPPDADDVCAGKAEESLTTETEYTGLCCVNGTGQGPAQGSGSSASGF